MQGPGQGKVNQAIAYKCTAAEKEASTAITSIKRGQYSIYSNYSGEKKRGHTAITVITAIKYER